LVPGGLALTLALGYGHLRLNQLNGPTAFANNQAVGPRIALIQGYAPADWKSDSARQRHIMDQYMQLSREAVAQAVGPTAAQVSAPDKAPGHDRSTRPLGLVVWPETMFRRPLLSVAPGFRPPPGFIDPGALSAGPRKLAALARQLDTAVLVGIDRHVAVAGGERFETAREGADGPAVEFESYNSAVMVQRQGTVVGTYDKMHRVMFGEYIPLAHWFPALYRWTPLTGGIRPGRQAAGLELNGVVYAPNICYETVLPHVIRRQVVQLSELGKKPDVLVNLTNDAWFWGSSELDMHLACGVLRAVEMRIPLVIAANGGLSAYVDPRGEVRQVSRRLEEEVLLVDVDIGDHRSPYVVAGDWFAIGCLVCCTVLALAGKVQSRESRARRRAEQARF
jgi:apolipoprotein N-acyltransferase